jgi:hypothetical protein
VDDWEFFDAAKTASVYLSLALLVVRGVVFFRLLPALPAANLLGVIAFGYYVFKAGYTQSELLFYTLHLLTVIPTPRPANASTVSTSTT